MYGCFVLADPVCVDKASPQTRLTGGSQRMNALDALTGVYLCPILRGDERHEHLEEFADRNYDD